MVGFGFDVVGENGVVGGSDAFDVPGLSRGMFDDGDEVSVYVCGDPAVRVVCCDAVWVR